MTEPAPIERHELTEILDRLDAADRPGVVLLGRGGSGKTVLMRMLETELRRRGRSAFYMTLRGVTRAGEVGSRIVDVVAGREPGAFDAARILRSSTGGLRAPEVVALLEPAGARLTRPVLLLDGLDETGDPVNTASTVDEIGRALTGWQVVVSSRPTGAERSLDRFAAVEVGALTTEEALALLRRWRPEATDSELAAIVERGDRLPLELQLLARFGAGVPVENRVESWLAGLPDPGTAAAVLERLALVGGRERLNALASGSGVPAGEIERLVDAGALVADDGSVVVVHDLVSSFVVCRRLRETPFRLADLRFGAEDAERDDLLEESYVQRQSLATLLDQRRSIVVGDRGAGKSAIFRKLSAGQDGVEILPVANVNDLLQKIAGPAAQDTDTLRAAWLVVLAAVVAAAVPGSAPRKLRREAAELRAAVGLAAPSAGRVRRAVARAFGGTRLTFAVGPVNLEAQLPDGGASGTGAVDVELFLRELDDLLTAAGRRVVVLFDRIDELFKYDRARQEAVVQGLLQVESRVSLLRGLGLVVFLRTDLFELYDIQEKNKLVSRRLVLKWSEEEWLQVLVRRVLANAPLGWAAGRLRLPDGGFESRPALGVLFPAEIEGRPIDRWLLDSVRNGNGDVSPRLAVLLLFLAREHSAGQTDEVEALPLFTADAVARAMTQVSELSFAEVVTDFKVAPSFVLNCRAGKRTVFTLAEVETLFEPDDGPVSEQVRLLERLGFLERIVVQADTGVHSKFRIPELYTRCWQGS